MTEINIGFTEDGMRMVIITNDGKYTYLTFNENELKHNKALFSLLNLLKAKIENAIESAKELEGLANGL